MDKIKLAISKWWATLAVEVKYLLVATIVGILIGFILCAASTPAGASERHHHNYKSVEYCTPIAVAGASGGHHYKASDQLQWSGTGAYADGKCDDSAVSFGLALQNGKVFTTLSFSSNFNDENMIVFSASGTF